MYNNDVITTGATRGWRARDGVLVRGTLAQSSRRTFLRILHALSGARLSRARHDVRLHQHLPRAVASASHTVVTGQVSVFNCVSQYKATCMTHHKYIMYM